MAEIITYPVNGKDFSAEDVETYMCTRTSGVWAGDLDYTVTAETGDNRVTVGDGLAWMRMSRFSGKSHAHKGVTILDAGLPDARLPRIDAVVLQYRAGDLQGKLIIKKGDPASDPQPPKVERTASLYELHLFHIKRNVGATKITPNDLVDLREDEKWCGVMYDDVTPKGMLNLVTKDDIGKPGGVASLSEGGKVPSNQLPSLDYIPNSQKGKFNGVATLDGSGKVPSGQLPKMDYIPTSEKGKAHGVATLNTDGLLDREKLPSYFSKSIDNNYTLTLVGAKLNNYNIFLHEYGGFKLLLVSMDGVLERYTQRVFGVDIKTDLYNFTPIVSFAQPPVIEHDGSRGSEDGTIYAENNRKYNINLDIRLQQELKAGNLFDFKFNIILMPW